MNTNFSQKTLETILSHYTTHTINSMYGACKDYLSQCNNIDTIVFADLDDTIAENSAVFSWKRRVYLHIGGMTHIASDKRLLENVSISSAFIDICNKYKYTNIVIITRNNHSFVKKFIRQYKDTLLGHKINIVGHIGTRTDLRFDTRGKFACIPDNRPLISDIFEWPIGRQYKNFICIHRQGRYSFYRYLFLKYWLFMGTILFACLYRLGNIKRVVYKKYIDKKL